MIGVLVAVILLFAGTPVAIAPNTVMYDGNTYSGRSESFHLDSGDYNLTWYSFAPDDYPEVYCGITLHVVTDDGYVGYRLIANEEIYYQGTDSVLLAYMPGGMYDYNVFGCAQYDIDIAPV